MLYNLPAAIFKLLLLTMFNFFPCSTCLTFLLTTLPETVDFSPF